MDKVYLVYRYYNDWGDDCGSEDIAIYKNKSDAIKRADDEYKLLEANRNNWLLKYKPENNDPFGRVDCEQMSIEDWEQMKKSRDTCWFGYEVKFDIEEKEVL